MIGCSKRTINVEGRGLPIIMLSKFELELLRPWVSGRITALLGGFNPTAVNTVLECIADSLNRQATTGIYTSLHVYLSVTLINALLQKN